MLPVLQHLFATPNLSPSEEDFTVLLRTSAFRLERITSYNAASPPNFWYDQPEQEWVMLVRGNAVLQFDPGGMLQLKAGDHLTIPAHLKHRVEQTSEDAVWLALHFPDAAERTSADIPDASH